ncbi:hypothetical protein ACFX2I_013262 [Malus domestica]
MARQLINLDVIKENLALPIQLGWWKVLGRGSCSAGLYFKDGVRNIKHGQWHDGVDISKRNSQHANENGKGNEDDGVLESCCGK